MSNATLVRRAHAITRTPSRSRPVRRRPVRAMRRPVRGFRRSGSTSSTWGYVAAAAIGLALMSGTTAVTAPAAAHDAATGSATQSAGGGASAPVAWPVAGAGGRISSGFGARWGGVHGGTDFAAPAGTPILAVAGGQVVEAGPATGFGLWVRIRHDDGVVSVYGHMNTITTRHGAHVRAGEQIATVGSRGQSTGPHLHLEIWPSGDRARRVDPARWLAERQAERPAAASNHVPVSFQI